MFELKISTETPPARPAIEAGRAGRRDVGDVLAGGRLDRHAVELVSGLEACDPVIASENARQAGPVAQGVDRRVAADEGLGVLVQESDADRAADARAGGSDRRGCP